MTFDNGVGVGTSRKDVVNLTRSSVMANTEPIRTTNKGLLFISYVSCMYDTFIDVKLTEPLIIISTTVGGR